MYPVLPGYWVHVSLLGFRWLLLSAGKSFLYEPIMIEITNDCTLSIYMFMLVNVSV